METATGSYHDVAYFFGGTFLANPIPDLVRGIARLAFQTPCASRQGGGAGQLIASVFPSC
jgi:hypothetical protein